MGTRVCSSKGTCPGHRDFGEPRARRDVSGAWGVPLERLPDDPGPGPVGILECVAEEVEAVYAGATNPAAGMPDATAARTAPEEAFLVVQGASRTETIEFADVVLPAATWGESDGTTANVERTVSRVRRATDPPSGVMTDPHLVTTLGEALAPGIFPSTEPVAVFEEFAALTRGTLADCSGISYERLDEEYAVRWPPPDARSHAGYRYRDANGAGGPRWTFPTPSGRARFSTATFEGVAGPVSESYPLTLTPARGAPTIPASGRARGTPARCGSASTPRARPSRTARRSRSSRGADPSPRRSKRTSRSRRASRGDPSTPRDERPDDEETDYEDPCPRDAKQSWYTFTGEESPAAAGEGTSDD